MSRADAAARVIPLAALEGFVERALGTAGVPPADARRIRAVLIDGELAGSDHGVGLLLPYLQAYAAGSLNPAPRLRVLVDEPVVTLLDGDRGHGVLGTTAAMEACIAKATVHGLACAGVRNSGHFGAAAPYAAQAAAAGLIGFVASNGGPMMPPTGGLTPGLGLNPQGWGIPAGGRAPVVLDVAPSMTVGGKVRQAALEGRALPEGVLADAEGRPTTDPTAPGRLFLPLGWPHAEHKGYGLALVLEVLCGVLLSGAGRYGQFCWALDPARFLPPDEFAGRMEGLVARLKGGRRRPGVAEIFVPGERGQRRRAALREREAIPLSAATWEYLRQAATATGVALPDGATSD
jgi:L-2-hydroxycarboxylate dehydrogenase (NAD+)